MDAGTLSGVATLIGVLAYPTMKWLADAYRKRQKRKQLKALRRL
jgi:hypothetical protein